MANIQSSFLRSSIWSVSASGVNAFSSTVIFIALARILKPEQLGTVVFATIFIELGRLVVVSGIADALIQRRTWEQSVADTAFWTNTVVSIVLAAAFSLSAPLLAISGGRDFPMVLAALSLILVVEGLAAVHAAKLRREFKDKFIAQRTVVSNIVGGVIGVGLAFMGWGVWAMVVGRLIAVSASSLILWFSSDYFPTFHFSMDECREFATFSLHQLGNRLLASANMQVIPMIVGAFLGASAIAQYRVGTRALSLISELAIAPLRNTTMSAFSRVREEKGTIVNAYLKVTRFCALFACPAYFGIAATATDLVHVVFGPQYREAGVILMALALVGGPVVLNNFQTSALASVGKTGVSLFSVAMGFVSSIVVSFFTVPYGAIAVAFGQSARVYLTTPFSLLLVQKGTGVGALDSLRNVAPPFVASLIMAGVITLLRFTVLAPVDPALRLVICIVTGVMIYGLVMLFVMRRFSIQTLDSARDMVPARIRGRFDALRVRLALAPAPTKP